MSAFRSSTPTANIQPGVYKDREMQLNLKEQCSQSAQMKKVNVALIACAAITPALFSLVETVFYTKKIALVIALPAMCLSLLLSLIIYYIFSKASSKAMPQLLLKSSLFVFVTLYLIEKFLSFHAPLIGSIAALLMGSGAAWLDRWHKQMLDTQMTYLSLQQAGEADQLQASLELVRQDEIDRRMLAADLHDQVLNDLKTLRSQLSGQKNILSGDSYEALDAMVTKSVAGVREVMDNLSPVDIEHLGLGEALRTLVDQTAERQKLKTNFDCETFEAEHFGLHKIEATLIYRLVQETLNNIVKHAQANSIALQIKTEDEKLIFRIADDGVGIDPLKFQHQSRGLRYMRQRATLAGATLAWRPRRTGSGTVVEISVDRSTKP